MNMSLCVQIRETQMKLDKLSVNDAKIKLSEKIEILLCDEQVRNIADVCRICSYGEDCNICQAQILRINEPFMKDFADE